MTQSRPLVASLTVALGASRRRPGRRPDPQARRRPHGGPPGRGDEPRPPQVLAFTSHRGFELVFSTLTRLGPDLTVQPELAESWTLLPDGRQVTLRYLTTRGRRSGQPRETELWFTRHAGRYYVITKTRDRAHWVRNLLVDPRVRWRVEGQTFAGQAHVLDGAAGVPVQALSATKYGWGDGLVVELAPDTPRT